MVIANRAADTIWSNVRGILSAPFFFSTNPANFLYTRPKIDKLAQNRKECPETRPKITNLPGLLRRDVTTKSKEVQLELKTNYAGDRSDCLIILNQWRGENEAAGEAA